MFAFLRTRFARFARSASPCSRIACIDDGMFEHLQAMPIAGRGAELREWLPVLWANGDTAMTSVQCRA